MRIARLTLASTDPAAQAEFWGRRLGLPVDEVHAGVEVVLRRSAIRFEPAEHDGDPRYHFAINVPRGTIEQAAAWLRERHEVLESTAIPMSRKARRSSTPIAAPLASTSSTPAATSSS